MPKRTDATIKQELILTLISLLEIENQLIGNLEVVGSPSQLRKAKSNAQKTSRELLKLIKEEN